MVVSVNHVLPGGLLAFLADNLAAHLMGGSEHVLRTWHMASLHDNPWIVTKLPWKVIVYCILQSHFEQYPLLTGPLCEHHSTSSRISYPLRNSRLLCHKRVTARHNAWPLRRCPTCTLPDEVTSLWLYWCKPFLQLKSSMTELLRLMLWIVSHHRLIQA